MTSIQYSWSVSASFRLKKDSSIRTKVSGSWQSACSQRSRRGFFVSQYKSTQPRSSRAFWSSLESNGRGVLYDSVMVWFMGRFQNKGIEKLEQRLRVLFGNPKGAVD